MGYGIISVTGSQIKLVALGIISLEKMDDHFLKLRSIFEKTITLIDGYHPDELAIEAPFFGKNVQSMLKLGLDRFIQPMITQLETDLRKPFHRKRFYIHTGGQIINHFIDQFTRTGSQTKSQH